MTVTTVLLADDDSSVREAFRSLLGSHGDLRVAAEVSNGHDAVVEALRLAPDVVILDISMSVLDGIEATRRIVRANPRIAVLIVSASDPITLVEALAAGARGYLYKPLAAAKLADAVRAVAAGRSYLGAEDPA